MKDKIKENDTLFETVFDMVNTISYGTIKIIVQDGKVIQLEKNEKIRLK